MSYKFSKKMTANFPETRISAFIMGVRFDVERYCFLLYNDQYCESLAPVQAKLCHLTDVLFDYPMAAVDCYDSTTSP